MTRRLVREHVETFSFAASRPGVLFVLHQNSSTTAWLSKLAKIWGPSQDKVAFEGISETKDTVEAVTHLPNPFLDTTCRIGDTCFSVRDRSKQSRIEVYR
jgi:hypothetical protein